MSEREPSYVWAYVLVALVLAGLILVALGVLR